jgi:uncharacterized protein involved in exopolysaccharide biosynthesis
VEKEGLPDFLRDPVGMLRRRWLLMLAALLVGVAATGVMALVTAADFVARATVLVGSERIPEEFVRSSEDDALEGIDELVSEVLSRRTLRRLIEEHGLAPDAATSAPPSALIAALRSRISIYLEQTLSDSLRRGRRQQGARVLAIEFRALSPEIAAAVANEIAQMLVDASIQTRTQQARVTTEFLRRELQRAELRLRDHNRRIREYQQSHRGKLPSELETNLRRSERLEDRRYALLAELGDAETRLAAAIAEESPSPDSELAELRAELARQLSVNTEHHPNAISLRRRIELLEAQIAAGRSTGEPLSGAAVAASRRETAELRSELAGVDRQLEVLQQRMAETPGHEEALAALEQETSVVEGSYLETLTRLREAELAEKLELAQQGEWVTILDPAEPPLAPERARWKLVVAGIFGSLGLAFVVGLVLEWWDPVIISPGMAESVGGAPVLGFAPRIR